MINSYRARQHGMTLVISLIILTLITLLALTSFNLGRNQFNIVGNIQQRHQAMDAAKNTLESTTSSDTFTSTPSAALTGTCNGVATANSNCYDLNGDGTDDVQVTLTPVPACKSSQPIPMAALDLSNPDDLGCTVGSQNQSGIVGTTSGNSLCGNTLWELNAVATDLSSSAKTKVTEGIAIRTSTDNMASLCP